MKTTNFLTQTGVFKLILCMILFTELSTSQQLAFPGAEGFGKNTTGGRGGDIYHVTNLNNDGAGSFRDAVSQSGRTVVFDVGGVIQIQDRIVIHRNVTVAGQTAPGGGITIYGNGIAMNDDSGNNIIRYIRIRMGQNGDNGKDAVGISAGQNYMFDHVSISWGRDGTLDVNGTGIDNLTFQDCIIGQGINNLNHSTGGLMQSGKWSMIRSLYIDNKTRNPKARGVHEFINSVLYNWGTNGYIMGDTEGVSECNLIGNYFIYGPSSSSNTHITNTTPTFYVYPSDNWVDSDKNGSLDGTLLTNYNTATVMSSPFNYPGVNNLMSARNALNHVINYAGASLVRDEVDNLLINQLTSYGTQGSIILTEEDNGIYNNVGTVANGTSPVDTDQDGMPDYWESNNGMNPYIADNNGDNDGDGYTNIEEYLDWIVNGTSSTAVSGVSLSPASVSLVIGSTAQLTETIIPSNAVNHGVSWSSSNSSIASVSSSGLVTGIVEGSAVITVTTDEGNFTAISTITVTSSSTTTTLSIQENEDGFCSVDGSIDNNNSGFTGEGFANTDNASSNGITWSVYIPSSGTYNLSWRYANGGSSDRTAELLQNGQTLISNISMPTTGSWTTWTETSSMQVYLSAGTLLIRLEATTSSGLANIDYFSIEGASPVAVSCAGLKSSDIAGFKENESEQQINYYPNPLHNQLNIQFSKDLNEIVDVYIIDMTGKPLLTAKVKTTNTTLDTSEIPAGIYLIRISGASLNMNNYLIKK